jgi:hypothetical protein
VVVDGDGQRDPIPLKVFRYVGVSRR